MSWDVLTPLLTRAGADPAEVVPRLRLYMTRLIEWNRGISNLISLNDETRLVERHLVESLEPAAWLKESGAESWLDFGTGAGLPGLPLALAGVGSKWTLVESRRPKTLFLRKIIGEMSLEHVEVVHARLEAVVFGQDRPPVDAMTSRATMPLGPTLKIAESVVVNGGSAFLWKGSRRDEELDVATGWEEQWVRDEARTLGEGPASVIKMRRR